MALYKGSNKIAELYYHGVAVAEIYKGNILVWTKAAQEYFVTISQAANGTISAAPMQGPAGTTVTLSNTPDTGYQLTYYTVNGNQIQGNTFTLDSDSTISGQFTAIIYTVTIGTHTNGSLSANPASGTYGTTVTLSGTPNSGYTLDYFTANGNRLTGNTFTLTSDTTVAAVYKAQTYPVLYQTYLDGHNGDNWNHTKSTNNIVLKTSNLSSVWSKIEIGTITASDAGLPSGYIGKKYYSTNNGASKKADIVSGGYIPTSCKEWTIGYWFRRKGRAGINNSASSCVWGGLHEWDGYFLIYKGTSGARFGYAYNGTWTVYQGGDTSNSSYVKWTGKISQSQWNYMAVYYNANTKTIEWYINGTLYLKYVDKRADSYWTSTTLDSGKYPRTGCLYDSVIYANDSLLEMTVYNGKYVSKPTAPIVPA